MNKEEIIKNLKYTMENHKNDTVYTFGTNISVMCKDILDYLEQEPCDDAIRRQAVLESIKNLYPDMPVMDIMGARRKWLEKYAPYFECEKAVEHLPSVKPQEPETGHCKDCKWWKDSDGLYRRGCHAESQCPINRREVFEGNGYCYMFEPQKRSGEE